ncbi:MAG: hypothetical protein AB7K68_05660 [Bacteriovoracia bacterium]
MEPARNRISSPPEGYSPATRLHAVVPAAKNQNTNIAIGALWMIGVTLALFFLPILNGLIGGLVGGYKVGSLKRALAAAVLPAVVAAAGLWVIFAVLGAPIFGVLASAGVAVMIGLSEIGIFLGATLGGYAAERPRSSD